MHKSLVLLFEEVMDVLKVLKNHNFSSNPKLYIFLGVVLFDVGFKYKQFLGEGCIKFLLELKRA